MHSVKECMKKCFPSFCAFALRCYTISAHRYEKKRKHLLPRYSFPTGQFLFDCVALLFYHIFFCLSTNIDAFRHKIGNVEAPNINKAVSLDTLFDIASVLNVPVYKFFMFDEI